MRKFVSLQMREGEGRCWGREGQCELIHLSQQNWLHLDTKLERSLLVVSTQQNDVGIRVVEAIDKCHRACQDKAHMSSFDTVVLRKKSTK